MSGRSPLGGDVKSSFVVDTWAEITIRALVRGHLVTRAAASIKPWGHLLAPPIVHQLLAFPLDARVPSERRAEILESYNRTKSMVATAAELEITKQAVWKAVKRSLNSPLGRLCGHPHIAILPSESGAIVECVCCRTRAVAYEPAPVLITAIPDDRKDPP